MATGGEQGVPTAPPYPHPYDLMPFGFSARGRELYDKVSAFIGAHIIPNEFAWEAALAANTAAGHRWTPIPMIEELKAKARAQGLWNLFSPDPEHGPGLSNLDYAPIAELTGRNPWAAEVFNCSCIPSCTTVVYGELGLAKDAAKAFEWFKKSHEAGDAGGTAGLGGCYLDGVGVPKCFARANTLLSDAARGGSKAACYNLGRAYAKGVWGFPKDETMARRYYSMVASASIEDCSVAGKEKAATWLREHPAA